MLNEASSCSLAYHPHIAGLTQEEEMTSFDYHTEKKNFFLHVVFWLSQLFGEPVTPRKYYLYHTFPGQSFIGKSSVLKKREG